MITTANTDPPLFIVCFQDWLAHEYENDDKKTKQTKWSKMKVSYN
jgi:hypothetical protein